MAAVAGFDQRAMFDDDYLYFYQGFVTEQRSDAEATTISGLLGPARTLILDAGCGYGRISNRLALLGYDVTGVDNSAILLDAARRDAQARGVTVCYEEGDMREMRWRERFDGIISWMAAFGYYDDEQDRRVLNGFHSVLARAGRLILQTFNRQGALAMWHPSSTVRIGDDTCTDQRQFDAASGRMTFHRTIVRGGVARELDYFVRLFTPKELNAWLCDAGFRTQSIIGEDGSPVTASDVWMTVVADKP